MTTLTPEEEEQLRPAYNEYLASRQKWHWKDGHVMDMETWWRSMADAAKDRAKSEGKW